MIARYIHGGTFAKTIESAAARDDDFAEILEAVYDAHLQAGEVTSMRSGAWRSRGKAPRAKLTVPVTVAPARAAAASAAFDADTRWVTLGRDETLGCELEVAVEVLEDALVFHLDFAEPAKLVEVCVGDVTVPVGPRDAHVEVRVARQPEIAFVVRSRQGAELHETFALVEETKGA